MKNNLKSQKLLILSWLVLVTAAVACDPTQAVAPRFNVKVPEVKNFSRESVRLTSNRVFLWAANNSAEKMARVFQIADLMDEYEQESVNNTTQVNGINNALGAVQGDYDSKGEDIDLKNAEISAKQDELAAAPEVDKAALQGELDVLVAAKVQLEKERQQLRTDHPPILEKEKLVARNQELFTLGQNLVAEAESIVTLYPNPAAFAFQFKDSQTLDISISGWKLYPEEKERDFSTKPLPGKKPTIRNVVYTERGGIFEFEAVVFKDPAQTQVRDSYTFKVSRVSYEAKGGSVSFSGELNRKVYKPDGSTAVDRGVAKLVGTKTN